MSETVREHFNQPGIVDVFDGGYLDDVRHFHLVRRRDLILEEFNELTRSSGLGRWLDAGCGAGLLVCAMAERGSLVTGIDFSQAMVERAGVNALERGVADRTRFETGSLDHLPLESGSLDGIVCAGVIEYFADPVPVFSEFARVLRPGGSLIVTFNNRRSPFRWLSGPAKELRARLLGRRVRALPNRPYTSHSARRLVARAGLVVDRWRWHTYAMYLRGNSWFPPLALARRLELLSQVPLLRQLAWGFVAVAHRPGPFTGHAGSEGGS